MSNTNKTNVPSGSEIESHVGGYEICNYEDPISKFMAKYEKEFVHAFQYTRNNRNNALVDLFEFVAQEYLLLYSLDLYVDDLPIKEKKLLKVQMIV